ncbi:MAG: prephenate dehydrogenase [Polyangiaceae bacterium]|nr:prephenate dehydrogenase [Polyangiaceae bacterium]
MKVAVVGLGLLGGSLALAWRARGHQITGIDGEDVLADPRAQDATDVRLDRRDCARVDQALAGCDVAVLATPVGVAVAEVARVLEHAPVVTDVGSTKRAIVAAAARCAGAARFVPGHPMAGAPRGGLARARAELAVGRPWLLCPRGRDPGAVARVEALVRDAGAMPRHTTPEEHDRCVAIVSHVPQLLASALVAMARRAGALEFAGPAFEGATRVAGGPEGMWLDIFATNGDEIAGALAELTATLSPLERELTGGAGRLSACRALLEQGRRPGE